MKDFIEYLQEQGITLTERGNRWWASCPFHADSNPSFTVSKKDNGYVSRTGSIPVAGIEKRDVEKSTSLFLCQGNTA